MRVGKIAVAVIGLVPFNVYGECTPTPNCADMGYTETSCEGDSLKCPFDTSMMKCMPCDSSFKYTCEGENVASAVGVSCGGKYVSCECVKYTFFNNGVCACDENCTVGAIYYSDGTCSSCVDSTKTAIGVVVKDNELVIGQISNVSITWGGYDTDVVELTNYTSLPDAKNDYNGDTNTSLIVALHTGLGETASTSAAMYCNEYITEGTRVGEWYLPAAGELYSYVYKLHSAITATMTRINWTFTRGYLQSSSEHTSRYGVRVNAANDHVGGVYKNDSGSVSCFLKLR